MIIPFVFNLEIVSNYDHITVFYYYLNFCKKNNWPIISHERYFQDLDYVFNNILSKNELYKISQSMNFDFPVKEDFDKIGKYYITEEFQQSLVNKYNSRLDAWTSLLRKNDDSFELLIETLFQKIEHDYQDKIEAILCFYQPVALRVVADKRNIPVIFQERTTFREPMYIPSGYFDFKDSYGYGELEERFFNFQEECKNLEVPILDRKEILSIFIKPEFIDELYLLDSEPIYELGICTYKMHLGQFYKDSLVSSDEILFEARQLYNEEHIICRGSGISSAIIDSSQSAYHFILKCKKIAAVHSNMLFEALLLGRVSCVYGVSPYAFMANKGLNDNNNSKLDIINAINFTVFAYFVPWELMQDVAYIGWRLEKPSEIEIYIKHLTFYLEKLGISKDILKTDIKERYKRILDVREININLKGSLNKTNYLDNNIKKRLDKSRGLNQEYIILQEEYKKIQNEYCKMQNEYSKLENEYSKMQNEYSKSQIVNIEREVLVNKYADQILSLENSYNVLEKEYKKLSCSYKEKENIIKQLQSTYENVQSEYIKLQNEYNILHKEYINLQEIYVKITNS